MTTLSSPKLNSITLRGLIDFRTYSRANKILINADLTNISLVQLGKNHFSARNTKSNHRVDILFTKLPNTYAVTFYLDHPTGEHWTKKQTQETLRRIFIKLAIKEWQTQDITYTFSLKKKYCSTDILISLNNEHYFLESLPASKPIRFKPLGMEIKISPETDFDKKTGVNFLNSVHLKVSSTHPYNPVKENSIHRAIQLVHLYQVKNLTSIIKINDIHLKSNNSIEKSIVDLKKDHSTIMMNMLSKRKLIFYPSALYHRITKIFKRFEFG